MTRLVSIGEIVDVACQAGLHCTVSNVWFAIKSGELVPDQPGRDPLFSLGTANAWLNVYAARREREARGSW